MKATDVSSSTAPSGREGRDAAGFLVKVTGAHVLTYFLVGMLAAIALDYESLFAEPVIRDYMRDFGSVSLFVGPLVQILRGLIVAAVLLPFRGRLAERRGWLWLWLLLLGIAILSTAAAAPSSIEGVVYTRLPLWYHLIGLPEMLLQTFLFSVVTHLIARHPDGVVKSLPPVVTRLLRAAVAATLAFMGYAVVSVVFALAARAPIDAGQSLTWQVQGVFVVPFLVNAAVAYAVAPGASRRLRVAGTAAAYVASAVAIFTYQAVVSGAPNLVYALVAPLLPALILFLVMPRTREDAAPSDLPRPD
jgi:hypothetical protein